MHCIHCMQADIESWTQKYDSARQYGVARSVRTREMLVEGIKQAILFGELKPGEPLVEEKIAEVFQVSRTPVRECLAILEHDGFIAPGVGRGLKVCPMTRLQFVEIFEANARVEPFLAGRAAQNKSVDTVFAISQNLRDSENAIEEENWKRCIVCLREFHRLVGIASGSAVLASFVLRNEERADFYLIAYAKKLEMKTFRISLQEHTEIYEAILSGETQRAEDAMTRHAESIRSRYAKHFA